MAKRRKKNYGVCEFIIIVIIAIISLYYNYSKESKADVIDGKLLQIHFIDVGQADSMLIRCNDEAMLIDAGNNDDGDMLIKYFNELGIKNFKYLIGTHAHEDHIGGMDDIIDNFKIDTFFMPDIMTTTKTFENVLDSLKRNNNYFDTPKIGDKYDICDASFEIIYVGDDETDLNSTSIVLRLTHGNNTFLFTGDTTKEVEKTLLDKNIESDVLKVAHHGSKTSNSYDFLKRVNPKYAVIEVGANNKYNLPAKTIVNRLDNLGIKIYRTDLNGTIIMESDGNVLKVKTEK